VRQALPEVQRVVTGKSVAKLALELAMKMPMKDAIAAAIGERATSGEFTAEQVERISGIALKLISDGLRADDAISVALHEPAHLRPKAPLPDVLKHHLFPPQLTGQNVVKLAFELNHAGVKMDDAITCAMRKYAAPKAVTPEQVGAVLEAAQQLFKDGRQIAEAFELALRKLLPKG
jgi:hypothetical protein